MKKAEISKMMADAIKQMDIKQSPLYILLQDLKRIGKIKSKVDNR